MVVVAMFHHDSIACIRQVSWMAVWNTGVTTSGVTAFREDAINVSQDEVFSDSRALD